MSTAAAETARAGAAAELAAGISLGIYEKALRSGPRAVSGSRVDGEAWRVFLDQVPRAGFSFLDLSIDESPEREARLDWDAGQCRTVRRAAEAAGTDIGGICLSVHRRIGPGSADPAVRRRAREVMARGLQVCHDLGVPVIQLAGYYCYYEDPNPDAEYWYTQLLADAVPLAARLGVVMGIENVDRYDVTTLTNAKGLVDARDTPDHQLYPDLGNIAEQGFDPGVELAAGEGHMVAMHAKDVRPGEPRRVEMGTGVVDWDRSFELLAAQGWSGRLMIEMWNDDAPDCVQRCASAREFIEDRAAGAGIRVVAP